MKVRIPAGKELIHIGHFLNIIFDCVLAPLIGVQHFENFPVHLIIIGFIGVTWEMGNLGHYKVVWDTA